MAGDSPGPTISLRERSLRLGGVDERVSKWFTYSFLAHLGFILILFLAPYLPSRSLIAPPVYTVDLVGGERIGRANFGTELTAPPTPATKATETEAADAKKETQKVIAEKVKTSEKRAVEQETAALNEKTKKEPVKKETVKETKDDTKSESASADSVRERLIKAAAERAQTRTETAQKSSKGEVLSSGAGEGEGAAAIGSGGRGGPGVVKGMDFIIYQNKMLSTIKDNWAWPGQRSDLRVVVHFAIKETGEIVSLKIAKPSGDPSYDESVLRAVKKSSPLPAPPENYRKDFADVELTFRPRDLGA
jgi:colicin import membrane protein